VLDTIEQVIEEKWFGEKIKCQRGGSIFCADDTGSATTRDEAESAARAYYASLSSETDPDEQLNAAKNRDWLPS
jgi:hypothetical protein